MCLYRLLIVATVGRKVTSWLVCVLLFYNLEVLRTLNAESTLLVVKKLSIDLVYLVHSPHPQDQGHQISEKTDACCNNAKITFYCVDVAIRMC